MSFEDETTSEIDESVNDPNTGLPLRTPHLNQAILRHVFRSATAEEIPLFQDRLRCLKEAGRVLQQVCCSVEGVIHGAFIDSAGFQW